MQIQSRLVARVAGATALVLGLGLLCGCAGPPRPARGVVLVLGAGLGPRVDSGATPALARLAASGRRFERAFAVLPDAAAHRNAVLAGLPEAFRAGGAAVGFVGRKPVSSEEARWDLHLAGPIDEGRSTTSLEEWVGGHESRPFLLVASLGPPPSRRLLAHPPADPGERAPPVPRILDGDLPFAGRPGIAFEPLVWTELARRRAEGHAFGRARQADAELARLLQVLGSPSNEDDVAIVVLGDPLPDLGRHGRLSRTDVLFDDALRVGLTITAPGLRRPGRVATGLATAEDVAPTLLALTGLPAAADLGGKSLMPALADPNASVREEALASVERRAPGIGRSLRTERYRYTEWPDGSVELYDHADDPHENVNLASRPDRQDTLASLRQAVAAAEEPRQPASVQERRPFHPRRNVVLIIVDDLNTRVGPWGAPVDTPNLDRLAAAGVRFENAYVSVAMCSPSRTSFMTGWRPTRTQVWNNLDPARPEGAVPLQEHFRDQGFRTASVGKVLHQPRRFAWDWTDADAGLEVDEYEEGASPGGARAAPTIPRRQRPAWVRAEGTDADQPDGLRARQAATLLRGTLSPPFFLAVGFVRPHQRWIAPAPYFDLYPPAEVALPPGGEELLPDLPAIAFKTRELSLPGLTLRGREPAGFGSKPTFRRNAIAAYQACVSFVDAQIGVVLEALDERDRWRDTVVVLVGDNGFHTGDHGGQFRKDTLFEQALRVPLIVVAPDLPRRGGVVRRPVSLLDLYPTVVQLAGLAPVPGLDGRSLVPELMDPEGAGEDGTVLSYRRIHAPRRAWSLRTATARYTLWPDGSEELYDLEADAEGRVNRARDAEYGELRARLRSRLEERVAPVPGG